MGLDKRSNEGPGGCSSPEQNTCTGAEGAAPSSSFGFVRVHSHMFALGEETPALARSPPADSSCYFRPDHTTKTALLPQGHRDVITSVPADYNAPQTLRTSPHLILIVISLYLLVGAPDPRALSDAPTQDMLPPTPTINHNLHTEQHPDRGPKATGQTQTSACSYKQVGLGHGHCHVLSSGQQGPSAVTDRPECPGHLLSDP